MFTTGGRFIIFGGGLLTKVSGIRVALYDCELEK